MVSFDPVTASQAYCQTDAVKWAESAAAVYKTPFYIDGALNRIHAPKHHVLVRVLPELKVSRNRAVLAQYSVPGAPPASPTTSTYILLRGSFGSKLGGSWRTNYNSNLRKRRSGGRVHTGYMQAAINQLRAIRPLLNKYRPDPQRTWIIGHSQGGAIALLMAYTYELLTRGKKLGHIVTFGQPNVGTRAFNHSISSIRNSRFTRFIGRTDMVGLLPSPRMGYEHLAPNYHLSRQALVVSGKALRTSYARASWGTALRGAHAIKTYIANIGLHPIATPDP